MTWTPSGSPGAAAPPTHSHPASLPSHVAPSLLAANPWELVQLSSALQYCSKREISLSLCDGTEMGENQARSPWDPTLTPWESSHPMAMHLPVLFLLPPSPHQEGGEDGNGHDQPSHRYRYGHAHLADS